VVASSFPVISNVVLCSTPPGPWLVFSLFFFSSRRRHTIFSRDWSSDVCSSDLCQYCLCCSCFDWSFLRRHFFYKSFRWKRFLGRDLLWQGNLRRGCAYRCSGFS